MDAGVDGEIKPIIDKVELTMRTISAEEVAEFMTRLESIIFTVNIAPLNTISLEALKLEVIKKLQAEYPDREVDITFVDPND